MVAEVKKASSYTVTETHGAAVTKATVNNIVYTHGGLISKASLYVVTIGGGDQLIAPTAFLWDIATGAQLSVSTAFKWNIAGEVPDDSIRSEVGFLWDLAAIGGANASFLWNINTPEDEMLRVYSGFVWDIAEPYAAPGDMLVPEYPITEEWQYLTSVFRSKNGTEQRRGYVDKPVLKLQFQTVAFDDERDFEKVRKIAEVQAAAMYPVPYVQYYDYLAVEAVSGDDRLYFDPQRAQLAVGGKMALINSDTLEAEVYDVVELFSDGVRIKTPVLFDTDGMHYACPVRYSRVNTDSGATLFAMYADMTYTFVSGDRTMPFTRQGGDVLLTTVDGVVILERTQLADNGMTEGFLSGLDVLDNGRAEPIMFADEATRRTQALSFLVQREFHPEDIDYWRTFAATVQGQRVSFGLPSHRADAVTLGPVAGETTLRLYGQDVAKAFQLGGYFGIMYDTRNSREYRAVSSAVIVGNNTELTLTAPIGEADGDDAFGAVSLIYRMRMSDDSTTLIHDATTTVVTLNVQMVKA